MGRSTLRTAARVLPLVVLAAGLAACGARSGYGPSIRGGYAGGGDYSPPGPPEDPWGPYVREAAKRFQVPEKWIREVMRQESGGRQYLRGQLTTSGAGAMGLMQVMPATYDMLRQRYGLGDDPFHPHNNILAGAAYIREMYDQFGSPGFLAAYNAGPKRLQAYLDGATELPNETVNYVSAIAPRLGNAVATSGPLSVYADAGAASGGAGGYGGGYRGGSGGGASTGGWIGARYASAAPAGGSGGGWIGARSASVAPAPAYASAAAGPTGWQGGGSTRTGWQGGSSGATGWQGGSSGATGWQGGSSGATGWQGGGYGGVQVAAASVLPTPPPAPAASGEAYPAPANNPPRPVAAEGVPPVQLASLPEPPPPPLSRPMTAPASFSLVARAEAAPYHGFAGQAAGSGRWAIQVGAYSTAGLARGAADSARNFARGLLSAAQLSSQATTRSDGSVLYRARLSGLSADSATQACTRLIRAGTNCIVVSPDAI